MADQDQKKFDNLEATELEDGDLEGVAGGELNNCTVINKCTLPGASGTAT